MAVSPLLAEIRTKAVAAAEAVYRVTEPETFDSSLRASLRRSAADILSAAAAFALGAHPRLCDRAAEVAASVAGVEELVRFAERRGLIAADNAGRILGAYGRVRLNALALVASAVESEGELPPPSENDIAGDPRQFNDRQQRILSYLASAGQAQIGQIRQACGDECSEKTLQRELGQMSSAGLITRQGDNRWTTYFYRTSDVR